MCGFGGNYGDFVVNLENLWWVRERKTSLSVVGEDMVVFMTLLVAEKMKEKTRK